jgi:hypothetical protein
MKYHIWTMGFHRPEMWALPKVVQKYFGSFELWCWRWMELSSTECVNN